MVDRGPSASIAEPSAGRIDDYLLGGNHNLEVDRVAAQQVPGFSLLEEWVGVRAGVTEAQLSSFGFSALGVILEK